MALNTTLLCLYMANINLFDPTCTSDNISDGLLLHPKMFRIYEHAFMRFIPQHKNYYDKPWGENGYYSSNGFTDAIEYHNFYKLCLYYDFMSFAPSCIESFVKYNNDIIQSRSTIIFMIK